MFRSLSKIYKTHATELELFLLLLLHKIFEMNGKLNSIVYSHCFKESSTVFFDFLLESSLTCDFGLEKDCNFKAGENSWIFSDKFSVTRPGILTAPVFVADNNTEHCFAFSYRVIAVDSVDSPPKLILYRETENIWSSRGHVGISMKTSGQVTLEGGVLNLKFESEGRGLFKVYETKLVSGACANVTGAI